MVSRFMNPITIRDSYHTAERLEQALGDPSEPQGRFSFQRQVALDEAEAFPTEICTFLHEWGLLEYFIPTEQGGLLRSFEEALALVRVLSRRDLTVAIALGQIYLGAVHVWLAGSEEQKAAVAQMIRQNQPLAFALTERAHGSDVLASDVQAVEDEAGYCLTGEKWLINNGTRARALTVFARTEAAGGARGFSLFLVDKEELAPATYTHHPKVKTHGIRGADISGIRFQGARLPAQARIGQPGAGLEIALRGLMVTRTLCAGFSLGAADSALRTVLAFARGRRLYGETVFAIPQAQQTLAYAWIDLLIADGVALTAARALHVAPEQFSIWSAIVKYFVPTTVERMIADLSIVLGARYYVREEHDAGLFQKVLRDAAVVSLFDGSTVVNLSAIGAQLASLTSARRKAQASPETQARWPLLFSLHQPLPQFEGSRLLLYNRGQDDVMQGLPAAMTQLAALRADAQLDPALLEALVALAQAVIDQLQASDQRLDEVVATGGRMAHKSPAMFELAKGYCTLHAAAACLQVWLYNRDRLGDFFARGEWLALALDRLLRPFQPQRPAPSPAWIAAAAQEAVRLYEQKQAFSLVPFQLAGKPTP
jgi:alkylation response protein AidB-like acyl-CoA dehydrogenase